MKEARSVVTAFFAFAIFLLVYALVHPGSARGTGSSPRFLRMEVVETRLGRQPEKHSFCVPYFLAGSAFRFAAAGAFRRELALQFDTDLDSTDLKAVWAELKNAPEGTVITRQHDGDDLSWKRSGELVTLQISKQRRESLKEKDEESGEEEAPASEEPNPSSSVAPPAVPAIPAVAAVAAVPAGDAPELAPDLLTLQLPVRVIEAAITADRNLDADALLTELASINRGDLIDIRHRRTHIRMWVE